MDDADPPLSVVSLKPKCFSGKEHWNNLVSGSELVYWQLTLDCFQDLLMLLDLSVEIDTFSHSVLFDRLASGIMDIIL